MKKIVSVLLIFVMALMTSVSAYAVDLSRLPLTSESECDYQVVEKSFTLKADLIIEKNEALVIPKGKRVTITNGKTVTLNGKLFIEQGGSLIINSGILLINSGAAMFSNGKVYIKSDGILEIMPDSSFVVSSMGSVTQKGKINAALKSACVACLGKYIGSQKGIKTEIINAVSFTETDVLNGIYEDFKIYTSKGAQKLFPKNIAMNKYQYSPSSGIETIVRFFCDNGQVIELIIHGGLDGKNGILNGIHIKA